MGRWLSPAGLNPYHLRDAIRGDLSLLMSLTSTFSIPGPRGCLGKQIAKNMIFSYFVTMLKNFDISVPEGSAPPSLQGVLKIAYEPKPYKIVALARS
jgi:hypothetical protein